MNNMVLDIIYSIKLEGTPVGVYLKKKSGNASQLWYLDNQGYIRSVINNMVFVDDGKLIHAILYIYLFVCSNN